MSEDDYPGDLTTNAVVDVGGSVGGALEQAGDHDWFKVYLRAGSS
jgi:hypothetical protein